METPRTIGLLVLLLGSSCITPPAANPAEPGSDTLAAPTPSGEPVLSPFLVVDQFGYLPGSEKVAVVRAPMQGFDAKTKFSPGKAYALVDAATRQKVKTGVLTAWNGGAIDGSSGDRAFWFDFSDVTTPGQYYVLDIARNVRSPKLRIGDDVYRDVLKHAVRMFYYQRAGFAKEAKYAGEGWVDGASHMGPLQDTHCRLFSAKDDPKTERDVHGGWYDAGDLNKYTSWAAHDIVGLLRAYAEAPAAFGDDYGIPESGNGIPDILDETKWGMDWLTRMQQTDGSLLSIVGESHASPPSAATGPSVYGPPNTSATLASAAAFAYGATVYRGLKRPELDTYADDLAARAVRAWQWADSHPNVLFQNNDAKYQSQGVGSGQQEVDDKGRIMKKTMAAVYLFELTKDARYRDYVDQNYGVFKMIGEKYVGPFEEGDIALLLHYARLSGATPAVAERILSLYKGGIVGAEMLGAVRGRADPYRAPLKYYTWSSNSVKSGAGSLLYDLSTFQVDPSLASEGVRAALGYVHYLHGVNPLGLVYLSNMSIAGAERSVSEFYHTWFCHESAKWDRVGKSTYGPPPGFLTGGPNASYKWDHCCPSSCGSPDNNAKCTSEPIPTGQPPQKSYKDMNTGWPLNSWEITEPDIGYQVNYIRLLSKFVSAKK